MFGILFVSNGLMLCLYSPQTPASRKSGRSPKVKSSFEWLPTFSRPDKKKRKSASKAPPHASADANQSAEDNSSKNAATAAVAVAEKSGSGDKEAPKSPPTPQPSVSSGGKRQSIGSNGKTYAQLVQEAIVALKDRTGSSIPAIKKWLLAEYDHLEDSKHFKHCINQAIKTGTAQGRFEKVRCSYKVTASWKEKERNKRRKSLQMAKAKESIYAFTPQQTNETFEDVGYGPLVVQRRDLLEEIIQYASPKKSVHISGCKGAGKSTVLNQIGELLVSNGKTVFFFENATSFQQLDVNEWIRRMAAVKQEAYILVDETQANVDSDIFTVLLKNTKNHRLTTIGAGVPHYQTISGSFKKSIATDRLFVAEDMLVEEGITDYFASNTTAATGAEIEKLLQFIRSHVGGHIYPLMWLAEHLVPKMKNEGFSVEEVIRYFESNDFRGQQAFQEMVQRILPDVTATDVRPLLYRDPDDRAVADLRKKGFCDSNGMIVSQFLFENFVSHQGGKGTLLATKLNHGIAGVQQLLSHTLPKLNWDQYGPHGGPIEDAMTFELLLGLSKVKQLDTRLFNPKLINAGTAARKPDLYFNSTIDSYIECVLTSANNATDRRSLDEHISRFYPNTDGDVYYNIGDSSFAIINYQVAGTEPLQPENQHFRGQVFDERVFTLVMPTKEVYRGSTLIASPCM